MFIKTDGIITIILLFNDILQKWYYSLIVSLLRMMQALWLFTSAYEVLFEVK